MADESVLLVPVTSELLLLFSYASSFPSCQSHIVIQMYPGASDARLLLPIVTTMRLLSFKSSNESGFQVHTQMS